MRPDHEALCDALGSTARFTYDGNGNLLTVTDALSHTITHTYDSMDRLATRTDPLGRAETFSYDAAGNLTSTADRKAQTTQFEYDALNRRVKSTFADGTSTTLTYDAAGRLAQADDSADPHRPISLVYDTLDRLVSETTALSTVAYQYDALGRRIALTLPNGVSTDYQYNAASRLTALIYRNAAGVLGDLTYTYDATGNRTGVGGSFARTLLPDPIASATYDAANRQQTFGDKTMTYDANGNVTSITDPSGVTTFTWDGRNRLSVLTGPGVTASFAYDAFGRRAAKQINGSMTQFEYDGADITQQVDTTGTTTYLRSLNIDEALSFTNRDGTYFSIYDPLGSPLAVTDQGGNPVVQYTYDPFGNTASTNPAFANPFQYTSREHDLPGFYYYRARYYSPLLHRFLTQDSIGLIGGDPNLYAYVLNNPLKFNDPTGEIIFAPVLIGAGVGAFG